MNEEVAFEKINIACINGEKLCFQNGSLFESLKGISVVEKGDLMKVTFVPYTNCAWYQVVVKTKI